MSNAVHDVFERPVLTVRIHSGLNAESFLAGLLSVTSPAPLLDPQGLLEARFPHVPARLTLEQRSVNGISGACCRIEVDEAGRHRHHDDGHAHEHEHAHHHAHRSPADIEAFYEQYGALTPAARELARSIWSVLASAEARVHGASPETVHFHEVGRTSNILAMGLIAELIAAVNPRDIVSSPVPLADGEVRCAHGVVTNPAPALLQMLDGVAVKPFSGEGEAVTPTGLAILLGLGARFDRWPAMRIERLATAFHNARVFEGAANGLVFALGEALPD